MNEEEEKPEPQKRIWPWLLLAGVIFWIALSVFWMWREVQKIKRQKTTSIEAQAWSGGVSGSEGPRLGMNDYYFYFALCFTEDAED